MGGRGTWTHLKSIIEHLFAPAAPRRVDGTLRLDSEIDSGRRESSLRALSALYLFASVSQCGQICSDE